jgi:tetratricopeptide (TPR) repeat protein
MTLNASGGNAETAENNGKALTYLAVSYYNDSVLLTRGLTPEKIDEPEKAYTRYKTLLVRVEPGKDFTPQDVEFYKNMARGSRAIYDGNPEANAVFFNLSNTYYRRAIELAPDDFQANYNLAVNFYNHGVHKIRRIDHNTEIFELIQIQDECVALFKQALPYMRKAHEVQPEHRKTLGGLMAIYRSLSDDAQAALFQKQLEELIKQGSSRD